MHREISIFGHKFQRGPFFLTLLGSVILIMLGNWQLKRLKQKNHFIATIKHNVDAPAESIDQVHMPALYLKILVKGI
jgi:cytochrome oxidase assembly protein ShyY1